MKRIRMCAVISDAARTKKKALATWKVASSS